MSEAAAKEAAIESPMLEFGEALLRAVSRARGAEPTEDLRLLVSALMAVLSDAQADGSVCVSMDAVLAKANEAGLALSPEEAEEALCACGFADGGGEADVPAPCVIDRATNLTRIYLRRFFAEEKSLSAALAAMGRAKGKPLGDKQKARAEELCRAFNADALQSRAVLLALSEPFAVICGGPGTGKTTTVALILECLLEDNPELRIGLAAPTGKATSRMRESIEGIASGDKKDSFPILRRIADPGEEELSVAERTIHKWLVTPTPSGERPGPGNPFALDVLIVDEASMIDSHLAARFFAAISPDTRLIVLGDKHQLAAVGPGSVFADISDAKGVLSAHTVELKKSRRFAEGTVIAELAAAINSGEEGADGEVAEILSRESSDAKWKALWHCDAPDPRTGLSASAEAWLSGHIARYGRALVDFLTAQKKGEALETLWAALWREHASFGALCAQRRGVMSVEAVNRRFERGVRERLAAAGLLPADDASENYPGRAIIVRRNDDAIGAFNGDAGIILPSTGENGAPLTAVFGESARRIPPSLLPEHDTAFAITIHQSQGSEFDDVGVFLPSSPVSGLASRELLYTAVTRTKSAVTVFGSEEVLRHAVRTPAVRVSGLADRLAEEAAAGGGL
ncbi:MAG: hypothetical protein ACFWTZ_01855 [Burkholderia sp.]|jgi:exodeoxyribonuclease V alpha subunit